MYKDIDFGHNWGVYEEKSIKLSPSRLEQVVLPSVFHTEEYKILRQREVDATMADRLISRGQTRSRKMQDHHLM
jgi:hypothetical protein